MPDTVVSREFLLWSELCLLWSIASYAIHADPLPEDRGNVGFSWKTWRNMLVVRIIATVVLSYWLTRSLILTSWVATAVAIHPWMRFRSPLSWTAEFETLALGSNLSILLALVRHFSLQPHFSIPMLYSHLSMACLVVATLLFVIRGGTYIVRGCLRKAGTLPRLSGRSIPSAKEGHAAHDAKTSPKSADSTPFPTRHPSTVAADPLDEVEINRGRLIGNLERLILTVVVAAGSYAALAFLVAAKGLVRSEDLQKRDFAEYFLVGSLSSALVALCAGIAIRIALLALWPQLLSLQMQ